MPIPAICTGLPVYLAAFSAAHRTTAAAPSPMAEHISWVNGVAMVRAARICSTLHSFWYWERGFKQPLWWFFWDTMAKCSRVVPYTSMRFAARSAQWAGKLTPTLSSSSTSPAPAMASTVFWESLAYSFSTPSTMAVS